ncbi:DUF423 domain-containing protein [Sediminibacterium roseum]|uniref:DUF423 domain-containing protein n=1 Tax=Sediminibacterium roseum TaxID=1978412 RepID=A0ABW9ZVF0_9BACT|nr:DUF423 domain-containing protein [Sediminibacterium roseum]NCI50460.1 DUF423 domain-containing protein [Sediminibacterium roseum]
MHKRFLVIAAFMGALAVILGAFAAHKLKELLTDEKMLNAFETAVRYQFYHVFALALTGVLYGQYPGKLMKAAGQLFILGTLFFSGSLYLLAFGEVLEVPMKWAGPVTPLGGLLLVAGWICLAFGLVKKKA